MLNEQIQLILGQVNATEMDKYVFMASIGSATTTYCAVVAPRPWADGGPYFRPSRYPSCSSFSACAAIYRHTISALSA